MSKAFRFDQWARLHHLLHSATRPPGDRQARCARPTDATRTAPSVIFSYSTHCLCCCCRLARAASVANVLLCVLRLLIGILRLRRCDRKQRLLGMLLAMALKDEAIMRLSRECVGPIHPSGQGRALDVVHELYIVSCVRARNTVPAEPFTYRRLQLMNRCRDGTAPDDISDLTV
jgi:hypothetical protein